MRISKLMMPAVTLAGALALAGCGGGSGSSVNPNTNPGGDTCGYDRYNGVCYETKTAYDAAVLAAGRARGANDGLASALFTAIDERIEESDRFTESATKAAFKDLDGDDKDSYQLMMEGDPFNKKYPPDQYVGVGNAYSITDAGVSLDTDTSTENAVLSISTAKSKTFGTSSEPKSHKENASFSGSYDGVDGTFRCTGGACTSVRDAGSNDALSLDGTWFFTPSTPTDKVTESELSVYGWWVDRTGSSDLVHEIQLYGVPGSGIAVSTGLDSHGGSATFKGKSLGKYAFQGSSNDHGHFRADASLTANFTGSNTVLSGEITNFEVGESKAERKWTVKLNASQALGDSAISTARNSGADNAFSGTTLWTIDGKEPLLSTTEGSWEGDLYTSGNTATNHPDAVLGGFDAAQDNALMIGSFGGKHEN